MRYTAWTKVVDGCTINEYPETLVETRRHVDKLIRNIDRCLAMLKE